MSSKRNSADALEVMKGHDNHPHICTTTVRSHIFLKMYRGRMFDELHFSHCLGAASEGGSETYRLCTGDGGFGLSKHGQTCG